MHSTPYFSEILQHVEGEVLDKNNTINLRGGKVTTFSNAIICRMTSPSDDLQRNGKSRLIPVDTEKQQTLESTPTPVATPKSLGAGVTLRYHQIGITADFLQTALPIGVFAVTLTTLSLSLMEWRGVTTNNVFVANFFFAAAFGLVVTAQWELSVGNGFAYTVFSAFGESNRVAVKSSSSGQVCSTQVMVPS